MSQPYVGEIRMFGGNFAPAGWAFCNGSLFSIASNPVLFQVIGTTYGGDGQQTFALPDLRGRIPIHQGTGAGLQPYTIGEQGGVEDVTLTSQQMPVHSHPLQATNDSATSAGTPANATANTGTVALYAPPAGTLDVVMAPTGAAGGSQPHDNMAPYLCVSFIIALFGVFPSQG
jgi:microcystin-dependent protein